MARDGSGDFSRVEGPYVNGNVADADEINAEMDDIADGLSDSINKAGTKSFAANQSMGGFRLTDLATPSSANDAARKAYVDSAITAATAAAQPLDATLTALAGLTTSASQYIRATGTDAFTMDSYATVLSNIGALNTTSGDARYAQLGAAGGNTFNYDATTIFNRASTPYLIQRNLGGTARGYEGADATYCVIDYDSGGTWRFRINNSTGVAEVNGDLLGNLPLSTETTGTLTSASANKHILATGGITLPNSVFAARNVTTIDGNGTSRTITRGSGVTMYVNGTDSATATLTSNGVMAAYWRTASICVLKGDVA